MKVVNVHQRLLHASPERVGTLIDSLGSPADALWPGWDWPRMKFDRPLAVGAIGGHGPIRYTVETYTPGQSVRFRFTAPKGFDGWHGFEVLDATSAHCVLEHRIEMRVRGTALLYWLLVIRPLHDVCVEDVLSQTQVSLGIEPRPVAWTGVVRLLRWLASGGRRRPAPPFAGNRHAR
jgi:hypothetical protein